MHSHRSNVASFVFWNVNSALDEGTRRCIIVFPSYGNGQILSPLGWYRDATYKSTAPAMSVDTGSTIPVYSKINNMAVCIV